MESQRFWIYILHCENDTFYTGYTSDLGRRFLEHQLGTGKCKYTRSFKPLSIAQSWIVNDKNTALKVEKKIKKMTKEQKVFLINNPNVIQEKFPEFIFNGRV